MFGQARAALLRIDDDAMQTEQRKEFKQRSAQAKEMALKGQSVPTGFCRTVLFYTFQFSRDAMLARSPLLIRELEYWAWLYGRWAIKEPTDMCNGPEFREVLSSAAAVGARLNELAATAALRPNTPVPNMLRNEVWHVMLRFSTVRMKYIQQLYDDGTANMGLRSLHADYRVIHRTYELDCASLGSFLKNLDSLITTQSVSRGNVDAQEAYCTRVFLSWTRAFVSSLQSGPAPLATNILDEPAAVQTSDRTPAPLSTGFASPLPSTFSSPNPSNTNTIAAQPWFASPPPLYSTVQHPAYSTVALDHPATGIFSLDSMARQTAAGYRAAGQ
jgi:hypothetical protein